MTKPDGCVRTPNVVDFALRLMPQDERPGFEAHLRECTACHEELAVFAPIVQSFVDWPTDIVRPPQPLWSSLAQRVASETGGEPLLDEERWVDEPPWKAVAPGISCKLLATDEASGLVSMLVRLAPNTSYPPHTHANVEELHLLDGELWIEDRLLVPGDYNRGEPGTGDTRVWSETGCTCVLITSFRDILG